MRAFGISRNLPQVLVHDLRLAQERKQAHSPIVHAILALDPVAAEAAGLEHVEDSLVRNLDWIEEVGAALNGGRNVGVSRRARGVKPIEDVGCALAGSCG